MEIYAAIPVMNQREVTQECLDMMRKNEGEKKIPVVIIDNGSQPPVRDWLIGLRQGDLVIRNAENVGVRPALNQAWHMLSEISDYIFYTHSDVLIYEPNWSDKLDRILTRENDHRVNGDDQGIGVAGFYGAKAIGTPDIYQTPYVMHQLVRIENVSGCKHMDAQVHGFRPCREGKDYEDVAVMDGFSLIVATRLLNQLGGFDGNYPIHHNYDNDICLESLDKHFRNIVIDIDAYHYGGRTDVGENWAEPFGKTKQQVHQEAHPILYKKWSPENVKNGKHRICLPARVI